MIDFIERVLRMPRVVMTVMILLLGAGAASYMALPKESFPVVDIPFFFVTVDQKGISARDAERLLAKPIEDRLIDLDGLESITSTSTTGKATIFLEFSANTLKDDALVDIRAEMDGVTNELPADADEPRIIEASIADRPVLSVAVYGNVPERTLSMHANALMEELESIGDVQEVVISGDRDEVLEIQMDLLHLEAYGITAVQLFDALAKNNIMVAGGTLDSGQGSFNVDVPGLISSAAEVYGLPLKTIGDTVVTFGDVATITRTFKDATEYAYVNGSPAITLAITKNIGTNIIEVSDEVRRITEAFVADWPAGVEYSFLLDQSVGTKNLFRSLEAAVLTAVALVLIMTIAFLGVRPAIMIGMSIPISFMMAFLVLQVLGMTINMMVMFGLVIAVGVLVDDPIVVVEYAERKLSEGVSRKKAFIMAARKMFVPVVGATATTLGAFVPLLFWPGIIGKFMSYLPIVVIVVMVASLISALIFMPVIGAFIAKHEIDEEEKAAADMVMYADKFDKDKIRGLTGAYVRMMSRLMLHPIITLVFGFGVVFTIFAAYIQYPTGVVAFPAGEPEYGTVSVVARGNYSPIEIRDYLIEVQDEILQVPGIQDVIMTFGGAQKSPPDTIGNFQLQLQPWESRVEAEFIFNEIRERVAVIPGLEVQIAAEEKAPPVGKDINMRVIGPSYEAILPVVARIRDYLENELGDTIEAEDGRPSPGIDWTLEIDRDAASRYNLSIRDLGPYVQLVTGGVKLGTYLPADSSDELDILARLPADQRSFDSLDALRIVTPQGLVPVSNFVTRVPVPKVGNITREDGEFSISVGANLETGIAVAAKVAILQEWQEAQDWPDGVTFAYGGAAEQTNETNAFMIKALSAAMFLIFIILLLEYNSFYQVFVTLSTVVMSTAGVLLGMLLTGMTFSAIMTGLGIVALAGIVVKNGIVLIDTYNHYNREEGVEPVKAMLLTTGQRVRPVLLTAIVTALGVIPMALNIELDFVRREIVASGLAGGFFVHLSAALVSGLLFSTVLTLVMVPVMITAPSVIGGQVRSGLNRIKALFPNSKESVAADQAMLANAKVEPETPAKKLDAAAE